MREVLITFDVEGPPFNEDFMDNTTIKALLRLLRLMEKYEISGLFFITASVIRKVIEHREIMELLGNHEIGYHGSSHSVRPFIFEYTDVKDYDQAVEASIKMETAENKKLKGEGGLMCLTNSFSSKKIESFRAPFLCWTPPHLEALQQLGLKFDFSTCIVQGKESRPVKFKGLTFYPRPISFDSRASVIGYVELGQSRHFLPTLLLSDIIQRESTVLMKHPATLVYHSPAHDYARSVIDFLNAAENRPRNFFNAATLMFSTELLFMQLSLLRAAGLIRITAQPKMANAYLNSKEIQCKALYETSMWAPRSLFGIKPKFLYSHFCRFFSNSN